MRSDCPIAGIPAATGDITLFNPQGSTDSRAIDVTAAITQLRATCQDGGNDVVSTVTFTVTGLRRDAGAARQVILPYFDVALRGGTQYRGQAGRCRRAQFSRGKPARDTRAPGDDPGQSQRRYASRQRSGNPDPPAQGRRGRCGDRSAVRPGGAQRRSPMRPLSIWSASSSPRTSSSTTQRARNSPKVALTRRGARPRRRASPGAQAAGMAARESSQATAAPKEQPPPESLRHQGPRAPDSLESAPIRGRRRGKALRR